MRIVVLDGYTLNPGDLSWEPLRALGEVILHDRSSPNEVPRRIADADAVLTNKVALGREVFEKSRSLRYVGVTATGFNIVDVHAAKERGITVTNVPAYGTASVAQAAFALLLELANRVGHHAQTVRDGRWSASPDFCYWDYPLVELSGRTFGVIGFGRIGRETARIAQGFGMRVLTVLRREQELPAGMEAVDLERLLRESDVVSLHCPLTEETKGLINAERLNWMKRSAFLLNTSRGPLIDEAALAEALQSERIAGAGLDVLSVEPPLASNPLLKAPNCFVTPHVAWATREARTRLMNGTVENLRSFLAGKPRNVVA